MTLRKSATALAVACAAMVGTPVAAAAAAANHSASSTSHATTAKPATSFTNIPVTGTARNGKAFTGHFTVSQFVTRHGTPYAVGTLTGSIGNHAIKATQVSMPAALGKSSTSASGQMRTDQAAACQILNLVLGPLHLNLLGLHVDLNQVVLNITGVPGAGNLLGNLLCGVANLLNQTPASGANLTGLLNIVEQLANNPGLASL